MNELVAWLEVVYRDRFASTPHTAILTKVTPNHLDEFLDGLGPAHCLVDGFIHTYNRNLRKWTPGVWDLSGDSRFQNVLLLVATCVPEGYMQFETTILAAGPVDELRALVEWTYQRLEDLHRPPKGLSWDDLILPGSLLEDLRDEVDGFLAGEALYRSRKIAWKKGLLFTGDPGNGKTMAIRVIASMYSLRVRLFIKPEDLRELSGDNYMQTDEDQGLYLLVFEDIDRLLSESSNGASADRIAQFLNTMDGYSESNGRLVIATANRPELLDPAIRARPSRFDRIFTFEAPDEDCRTRYLTRMLGGTAWDIPLLAARTGGLSMAFLKELCILCLRHEQNGEPITVQAMESLLACLRRHATLGKKAIGMGREG